MFVGELISGLEIRPRALAAPGGAGHGAERVRICDITEDSRTAMPGSLFVARRGLSEDGRRFVPQAIEAGAVAVLTDDDSLEPGSRGVAVLVAEDVALAAAQLAERFYGRPSSRLRLVGITGTNGKTTITYLVHQLLSSIGLRCGMISTVEIDDGREIAPAALTTPPAIEISRTLSVMVESECRAAVMEVSSHALHQKRVAALEFDVGVFTNLSGDHLDYHGTMEEYAAAKAELFAMLPRSGVAIVNAGDPAHERMIRDCRARVVRCAFEGSPGFESALAGGCTAQIVGAMARSTQVVLRGPWGRIEAELPLIGPHNVMNLLQAVAVVHELSPWRSGGLESDPLNLAGGAICPPPGRLELVSGPDQPITVYVDYAHSDDALENVLSVLAGAVRQSAGGTPVPPAQAAAGPRLWCVFGCGGDRDRSKRPRMGRVAAKLADVVIVTSDNPRTEQPRAIIDEVLSGALEHDDAGGKRRVLGEDLLVEEDRDRAIRLAVRRASPGDVVLIAGKGHEDYQIVPDGRGGTVRRYFDDRVVAREALEARFGAPATVSRGAAQRRRGTIAARPAVPRRHEPEAPPLRGPRPSAWPGVEPT